LMCWSCWRKVLASISLQKKLILNLSFLFKLSDGRLPPEGISYQDKFKRCISGFHHITVIYRIHNSTQPKQCILSSINIHLYW
jgi:hypothetical protein